MKKALSLLLVCSLLLTVMLVFTACGEEEKCTEHVDADKNAVCDNCEEDVTPSDVTFPYYLGTEYDETDIGRDFGEADLESALTNMDVQNQVSNLLLFNNYNAIAGEYAYAVLNTESGEVVFTHTKEMDGVKATSYVSIGSVCGEGVIYYTTVDTSNEKRTEYSTAIYTALGKKIATADKQETATSLSGDLFAFDGKIYELTDGVCTYKFNETLASIPACDVITEKYNYKYDYETSELFVYDGNFALVSRYVYPTNATNVDFCIMNDGNVIIQYQVALPEDAAEYDIYSGGTKFTLESKLFNAENGSVTELDLGYVINYVDNGLLSGNDEDSSVKYDKITNVASIRTVENHTLSSDIYYVCVDNNGKILYNIAKEVDNQSGTAYLIADGRYVVNDHSGKRYLFDENAELIGEITNADYIYRAQLFYFDGVYYDLDLKEVFDTDSIYYPVYYDGDYGTVYVDEKDEENNVADYYLERDGKMIKLDLPDKNVTQVTVSYNYITASHYVFDEEDYTYTYYVSYLNFSGELIYTVNTTDYNVDYSVDTYGDLLIIRHSTYNNGARTTRYYIATK